MSASAKVSIAGALLLVIVTSLAFALHHPAAPAATLPIATTQNPPSTQDSPSLTLKPGVGIGDLKFGDSPERITKVLGNPENIVQNVSWGYPSKGIWFAVYPKTGLTTIQAASKGVYSPSQIKPFAGKTDTDLGIGSTREQIEAVYGKPRRTDSAGTDTIVLYYDRDFIWFMLQSNHVIQIFLNPPPGALAKPATTQPDQKAEATRALDQCRQSLALLDTSEYSYEEYSEQSPPIFLDHDAFSQTGHIRRDARGWWFASTSYWSGPGTTPVAERHSQESVMFSLLDAMLTYQMDNRPLRSITIWPKTNPRMHAIGTLGDGTFLEGILSDDSPITPVDNPPPPTFLDVIQNEFASLRTQTNSTDNQILLTSQGPHGLYALSLDPAHHYLPTRLEVTKTGDDLLHGEKLPTLIGRSQNGFFEGHMIKAHLLIDHVHFTSLREGPVIDAAEFSTEYVSADGETFTRHVTLHRTNIHINPKFTESDFYLPVPDGTPVQILNRDPSRAPYPKLEYVHGQILRSSDHQPPTEEESTSPQTP